MTYTCGCPFFYTSVNGESSANAHSPPCILLSRHSAPGAQAWHCSLLCLIMDKCIELSLLKVQYTIFAFANSLVQIVFINFIRLFRLNLNLMEIQKLVFWLQATQTLDSLFQHQEILRYRAPIWFVQNWPLKKVWFNGPFFNLYFVLYFSKYVLHPNT